MMTSNRGSSIPLDIYNIPLHDDELLDGIDSLPSPLPHHLFTLQTMHSQTSGRISPSTASTNSDVLPSFKPTTQDLAEFLRTSCPADYQHSRASYVRETYKKAVTLLRSRSKSGIHDPQLPHVVTCTTSNGKRYLQIQLPASPAPPPPQMLTPAPSPPQSLSSMTPSLGDEQDALSPAPWSTSFPDPHPVEDPKPRSYSMEAVGGPLLETPASTPTTPSSSPKRRRTPPRPGPPPARSLPALPETPPLQMTRAQKVRAKKLRDLAAAKERAKVVETKVEKTEVERRLEALERRNEVLENALVAVIRGSVLGAEGEAEKNGLEAFLRELIRAGGV